MLEVEAVISPKPSNRVPVHTLSQQVGGKGHTMSRHAWTRILSGVQSAENTPLIAIIAYGIEDAFAGGAGPIEGANWKVHWNM